MAVRVDHEGVAAYWYCWECFIPNVFPGLFIAASYGLEGVAVEMEGMFSWVVAVEDDVDYLALFKDERVGVFGVDAGIGGGKAGSEGSVESGDFRADVGYVIEGGAKGGSTMLVVR